MERFEEAVPLYLTACTVEGKTDRTVQSYAETLRQFQRAVGKLDLPVSIEAFGPAHVYLFMGWVRDRGVSAGTQHRRQREVLPHSRQLDPACVSTRACGVKGL